MAGRNPLPAREGRMSKDDFSFLKKLLAHIDPML
jgi:hypothetical protein